jgi:hypothetical protein
MDGRLVDRLMQQTTSDMADKPERFMRVQQAPFSDTLADMFEADKSSWWG